MDGDSATSVVEGGVRKARDLASSMRPSEALSFGRAFVRAVVRTYWHEHRDASGALREPPAELELGELPTEASYLAAEFGKAVTAMGPLEAAYTVGLLYTGMMPARLRAERGAYYTPPALCERLLDQATRAGVDWSSATVLDPACGGGAFLAPVARRMADHAKDRSPEAIASDIERRLVGFEVDPFAAWLSEVFVDVVLTDVCRAAGRRLRPIVRVCDSLEQMPSGEPFALVVGNPPYGRVKLPPRLRSKFARSLFGHANLYGVFTDLALRFVRPAGGVVAYVTPTSFLAGEYFKALRRLLGREAPPASIDFVAERRGVFSDVLQETLLAVYSGSATAKRRVNFIAAKPDGTITTVAAGAFALPDRPEEPWLMPRNEAQAALLRRIGDSKHRLADWGYTVSTGPLVWNRHKASLRERSGRGTYPLVWAESVRLGGRFEFRSEKRNHRPYFEPRQDEHWVVTDFPCVLLQRTTAKEQCRRLIAAELPPSFVSKHGAVVVENHLNMVKPLNGSPQVAPSVLTALLNSDVADQVFRCINGSVAVSAYELQALPLPPPESVTELERLVTAGAERDAIEQAVARAYGCA